MYYPVVIHQEGDSCYGVIVPDVPGCFSAGDTLEEAIDNAHEAIDLHFEMLAEDGDDIPSPADIQQHQENEEYEGGVWALVKVDPSKHLGKAQRVNISLPSRLLSRIDRAVEHNSNYKDRSKFLAEAALKALA